MSCPVCSRNAIDVLESRLCANGTRRRRYVCLGCDHRWTIWDGPRPRRGHAPGAGPKKRRHRPPLSPEEVRLVLTSPLNCTAMARQLGCSKQAVSLIRRGQIHADLWPELPRQLSQAQAEAQPVGGLSCYGCRSWRDGRCIEDMPDLLTEGPSFAADCPFFTPTPCLPSAGGSSPRSRSMPPSPP